MSNRILVDGSKAAGKAALEFIDALNEALAKGRRLRGQLDAMAWGSPADYAQVATELGLPAPSVNSQAQDAWTILESAIAAVDCPAVAELKRLDQG
jgi:hypothetical protein